MRVLSEGSSVGTRLEVKDGRLRAWVGVSGSTYDVAPWQKPPPKPYVDWHARALTAAGTADAKQAHELGGRFMEAALALAAREPAYAKGLHAELGRLDAEAHDRWQAQREEYLDHLASRRPQERASWDMSMSHAAVLAGVYS
jgi:hypothetical protein